MNWIKKITGNNYKIIAAGLSVVVLALIYSFQSVTPLVQDALAGETDYEELASRIETQINENVSKRGYLVEYYVKLEGSSLRIFRRYDRPCEQLSPGNGSVWREAYLDLNELESGVRLRENFANSGKTFIVINFKLETKTSLLQISQISSDYIVKNGTQDIIERFEKLSEMQLDSLRKYNINSHLNKEFCGGVRFVGAPSIVAAQIYLKPGDYRELVTNLSKYIKYINAIIKI